jgi:hypothetical protein
VDDYPTMPRVVVSARHLELPSICVCCGATPNRSLVAKATRIGARTKQGIETKEFEFPVCARCVEHHAAGPDVVTERDPQCEADEHFADYVEWSGTDHVFRFDSQRFARAFARENQEAGKRVVAKFDTWPGHYVAPPVALTVRDRTPIVTFAVSEPVPLAMPLPAAPPPAAGITFGRLLLYAVGVSVALFAVLMSLAVAGVIKAPPADAGLAGATSDASGGTAIVAAPAATVPRPQRRARTRREVSYDADVRDRSQGDATP